VSNICQAVFIAYERLIHVTPVSLAMGLFKLASTWIGLRVAAGLPLLAGVIIGTSLVGMLFNLGIVYWRFVKNLPSEDQEGRQINLDAWTNWLRETFPFVFITLFYTLDYQLDVVMLSAWRGEEAVGLYSAATAILFALLFISRAFREAIFPVMSRLYPSDLIALRKVYSNSARWLLAIALPVALGGTAIAGDLMTALYGESFDRSGPVLQIIIWAVLFLFLNVPSARLMIVAGEQRPLARYVVVSLSVNLLFNALIIPSHSYVGAAVTRLLSSALLFLLVYSHTYRHLIQFNLTTILLRPFVSASVMGVAVWLIKGSLPILLVIVVGVVSYGVMLWLVGFLSPDERDLLKHLVSRFRHHGAQNWIS
jgi:O-antigen/teichoic acid export membrane protein